MELSREEINSLFQWIDDIPLSRPKKNITRDFSDGVATAEILCHYFPKLVDKHNYSPANAATQKMYNWKTLNQKVFKRLGYTVTEDFLNSIVSCKPGYIEYLLYELRQKIYEFMESNPQVALGGSGVRKLPSLGRVPTAPHSQSSPEGSFYPSPTDVHPAGGMYPPYQGGYPMLMPQYQGIPPQAYPLPQQSTQLLQQQQLHHQAMQYPMQQGHHAFHSGQVPNGQMLSPATKEKLLVELQETIQILQLKVEKLEQLVALKDKRIAEFQARLSGPSMSGEESARKSSTKH